MRMALLSYFDLGFSVGLNDQALRPDAARPVRLPATTGLVNPMGEGRAVNLVQRNPALPERWREAALAILARPESGSETTAEEAQAVVPMCRHRAALWLRQARFDALEVVVYAAGVASLRLQLADAVPVDLLPTLGNALEFAGYGKSISDDVLASTLDALHDLDDAAACPVRKLTRRPAPRPVVSEIDPASDESSLFTSFTTVALCVDAGDVADVVHRQLCGDDAAALADPALRMPVFDHGVLWFDWAGCTVALSGNDAESAVDPASRLASMGPIVRLVEIGLVFLAVAEAMDRLTQHELAQQVDGHLRNSSATRSVRESNRLRTFVTAIASQCEYLAVAPAESYQRYFTQFERHAGLRVRLDQVRQRCEVLYSIQVEEVRASESERQDRLNLFVLTLTAITVASVVADVYGYIRGDVHLLPAATTRIAVLVSVLLLVVLTLRLQVRRRR